MVFALFKNVKMARGVAFTPIYNNMSPSQKEKKTTRKFLGSNSVGNIPNLTNK